MVETAIQESPVEVSLTVPPLEATLHAPVKTESKCESSSDDAEMLKKAVSGRYDIGRRLGAGGMATVFLAREIALERPVAVKVLSKAFSHDASFVSRFKREAKIAAGLEHQLAEPEALVFGQQIQLVDFPLVASAMPCRTA